MTFLLSRNKALTFALLSTHGTASLLSRDGHEVKVTLAPLLGASTLVRSLVAESNLHPGIHGPLTLSFEVATDVLGSVADMLVAGESEVKEENIDEIMQVLDSLGVEANLGKIVCELTVIDEEDILPEKVRDEESNLSGGGAIEVKVEAKQSLSESNIECEHIASNEGNVKLEIVLEPVSDEETGVSDGDVCEAKDISLRECNVNIEKIRERYDQSYRTCKNATGKTGKKCNICNFSAKSPSNLKMHMRSHTGEKPYKCTICNFCCSSAYKLKRHNRVHTREKSFKCKFCKYSCSDPTYLKVHHRIHTGERPFRCKMCTYSSSDPSNLRVHNRIHTGEKPYRCKICNKTFSRHSHLRSHGIIHTREKNDGEKK